MPALSQSRFLRFLMLGALYFAQGVPTGFVGVAYVVLLADHGLNNQQIGMAMGLAAIPWAFKIIIGLLIDRVATTRFGRRRPFILLAQLGMGATLLLLLLVDPQRELPSVGLVLLFCSAFAAFQDVSVDGLAVDLLQPEEMSTGNGAMLAGRSVGFSVGGGGGVVIAKHLGWPALFCGITALIWAVMLFLILVRERPRDEVDPARERRKLTWAELRSSFSFAEPLLGIALGMLGPISGALITNVLTRMLRVDLKLSMEVIGTLEGVVFPLAAAAGGFTGGWLASRLGMRKAIGALLLGLAGAVAVFALASGHRSSLTFLTLWLGAMAFFGGAHGASMYGFFMMLSNPAVGATQFSAFLSAALITSIWAAPLGGWIADTYGITTLFLVAALAQLTSLGLLPFCDPHKARARFRPAAAGGTPPAEVA
jgi:PAT family beta-lactamase induction signal transducer AmpG